MVKALGLVGWFVCLNVVQKRGGFLPFPVHVFLSTLTQINQAFASLNVPKAQNIHYNLLTAMQLRYQYFGGLVFFFLHYQKQCCYSSSLCCIFMQIFTDPKVTRCHIICCNSIILKLLLLCRWSALPFILYISNDVSRSRFLTRPKTVTRFDNFYDFFSAQQLHSHWKTGAT